jgi:hypothetical protein
MKDGDNKKERGGGRGRERKTFKIGVRETQSKRQTDRKHRHKDRQAYKTHTQLETNRERATNIQRDNFHKDR